MKNSVEPRNWYTILMIKNFRSRRRDTLRTRDYFNYPPMHLIDICQYGFVRPKPPTHTDQIEGFMALSYKVSLIETVTQV